MKAIELELQQNRRSGALSWKWKATAPDGQVSWRSGYGTKVGAWFAARDWLKRVRRIEKGRGKWGW